MTIAKILDHVTGLGVSDGVSTAADVAKIYRRTLNFATAASVTTSAAGATTPVASMECNKKLAGGYFLLNGTTMVAVSTNYAGIELHKLGTNGTTTTLLAYVNSASTNITNKLAKALTLSTSLSCKAGETLWYQAVRNDITTGIAISAGFMTLDFEETD